MRVALFLVGLLLIVLGTFLSFKPDPSQVWPRFGDRLKSLHALGVWQVLYALVCISIIVLGLSVLIANLSALFLSGLFLMGLGTLLSFKPDPSQRWPRLGDRLESLGALRVWQVLYTFVCTAMIVAGCGLVILSLFIRGPLELIVRWRTENARETHRSVGVAS
jgi:hypothetical protein